MKREKGMAGMMRQETKETLIQFLENRKELDVAGNSLLVFHKDEEVFRHYTGEVNKDTLFRIFSMTKVITVTAALQLYEKGAFQLDEPLWKYIPEYKDMTVWNEAEKKAYPAKHEIRIRDLFCMSAGLTYPGEDCKTAQEILRIQNELEKEKPNRGFGTVELIKAIAKAPLRFEPGTHWCYSYCHDVLGALVEILSGETFGDYLKKHIFMPLGMEHTFFQCDEETFKKVATFSGMGDIDKSYQLEARFESGGGGLLSTLDDYMKFANTLTRGGTSVDGVKILGRKTIELMATDQLNPVQKQDFNWDYLKGYSYGLGVRTYQNPAIGGVAGSVGEFGWCGVLGTWVLMDPKEELTIVYMHQRMPNLEGYLQPRLRAIIYGD